MDGAARIGICILTCATADDLLARVREVKEEESNRARWFEDDRDEPLRHMPSLET